MTSSDPGTPKQVNPFDTGLPLLRPTGQKPARRRDPKRRTSRRRPPRVEVVDPVEDGSAAAAPAIAGSDLPDASGAIESPVADRSAEPTDHPDDVGEKPDLPGSVDAVPAPEAPGPDERETEPSRSEVDRSTPGPVVSGAHVPVGPSAPEASEPIESADSGIDDDVAAPVLPPWAAAVRVADTSRGALSKVGALRKTTATDPGQRDGVQAGHAPVREGEPARVPVLPTARDADTAPADLAPSAPVEDPPESETCAAATVDSPVEDPDPGEESVDVAETGDLPATFDWDDEPPADEGARHPVVSSDASEANEDTPFMAGDHPPPGPAPTDEWIGGGPDPAGWDGDAWHHGSEDEWGRMRQSPAWDDEREVTAADSPYGHPLTVDGSDTDEFGRDDDETFAGARGEQADQHRSTAVGGPIGDAHPARRLDDDDEYPEPPMPGADTSGSRHSGDWAEWLAHSPRALYEAQRTVEQPRPPEPVDDDDEDDDFEDEEPNRVPALVDRTGGSAGMALRRPRPQHSGAESGGNRFVGALVAVGVLVALVAVVAIAVNGSGDDSPGAAAPLTGSSGTVTPGPVPPRPSTTPDVGVIATPGCEQKRSPGLVSGTDPGGTTDGPSAILAFERAYYVQRSGFAARAVVAEDSTVPPAEQIQRGINQLPMGTLYCVEISPAEQVGDLPRWRVRLTQQFPGESPKVFTQLITTRTAANRTLITAIAGG